MRGRSVNRAASLSVGAVYLLAGVGGFFVTKFEHFATYDAGKLLGIFQINPLHNIVHIVTGLFLLGAARGQRGARRANTSVGAAYALVFVLGLFLAPKTSSANFLALNQADNGLHLATAVLLLAVALLADKAYTRHGHPTAVTGGATRL